MKITVKVSKEAYEDALDNAIECWDPRGWPLEDFLTKAMDVYLETNFYEVIAEKMRKDVPSLRTRKKREDFYWRF